MIGDQAVSDIPARDVSNRSIYMNQHILNRMDAAKTNLSGIFLFASWCRASPRLFMLPSVRVEFTPRAKLFLAVLNGAKVRCYDFGFAGFDVFLIVPCGLFRLISRGCESALCSSRGWWCHLDIIPIPLWRASLKTVLWFPFPAHCIPVR